MLIVNTQLIGMPVVSIHAGGRIATTTEVIIDPHNLTVAGFYVARANGTQEEILLPQDIRETDGRVLVINHEEDLAMREDLIRLKQILDLSYELVGKQVVTKSNSKLGVVEEYVVESESLTILNLHITPSLLKSFMKPDKVISRKQVEEITDTKIIVAEATLKQRTRATQVAPST